ncbi:MAG: hypothetical protein GF334_12630 [Candidatus Altiarchaeales archaeon]|nr:hypothetical protein [Candidatus Altiarchaeales archaeon]
MEPRKALYGIIFLFLFFRIPHLSASPQWFWDEGINMDYAQHLLSGRSRWSCMKYAWIPHPPLYPLCLAVLFKVGGYTIEVARGFSVALNLATLYLIYLIGTRVEEGKTALTAAALFAIYPAAIYWGRMAFSNNLLMFWIMLSLYFFITHLKTGGHNILFASASMGFALITSYSAILITIPLGYYVLVKERKHVFKSLALLFAPITVLLIYILATNAGVFLFDLSLLIARFELSKRYLHVIAPLTLILCYLSYRKREEILDFSAQVLESESKKIFNVEWCFFKTHWAPLILLTVHAGLALTLFLPLREEQLFGGGDYFWLGIIGLLFINSFYMNTLVLVYFLPFFMQVIMVGRTDHMLIPLYPFFCLGVAVFLDKFHGYMKTTKTLQKALSNTPTMFAMLILPFIVLTLHDTVSFVVNPDTLITEDIGDVEAAAEYVDQVRKPGQHVLATSHLTRYIKDPVCVVPQGFAYEGHKIAYYPQGLPEDRFTTNCSYKNSAYLAANKGVLNWLKTFNHSEVNEWIRGYEEVFESGRYIVYRHRLGENNTAPKNEPSPES